MIKPEVGRVCWYRHTAYDRGELEHKPPSVIRAEPQQPCAATIAYVHSDTMVNLSVVDHNGRQHSRTSVALLQDNDVVTEGLAYAEWMPYQKGQAAKTEQLESALAAATTPAT